MTRVDPERRAGAGRRDLPGARCGAHHRPPRRSDQGSQPGVGAGELLVRLAECMLAGGDFYAHAPLDTLLAVANESYRYALADDGSKVRRTTRRSVGSCARSGSAARTWFAAFSGGATRDTQAAAVLSRAGPRCGAGRVRNCAAGDNVAGATHIQTGATIGSNACVLQGLTVGANATVGEGAVVTRSVPARTVVKGFPAHP